MNYRINGRVIALVGVLVVAAASLFIYTLVRTPAGEEAEEQVSATMPAQQEDRVISGKHQYKDGMHTIAGMVSVDTPCHSVVVEPFFVDGTEVPTVELRFTTVREGDDCPEQVSDAPYRVTFDAPENAVITALWNGAPVRLNLVPVASGESLEEEFYFKG